MTTPSLDALDIERVTRSLPKFSRMAFELSFKKIPATPSDSDLQELVSMARITFADTFQHYKQEDIEDYLETALSPNQLGSELEETSNFFYFVLKNESKVGFLKFLYPTSKYLEHSPVEMKNPLLLERFYFLPEYCGQGLAAVAMEFVQSYARYEARADYLYLSVWEKNYRAQSFYQKHGFRTLSSFDYPVGSEIDHELLFAKKL